ncbi:ABC transporter ATP-binding protein [Frankia sp. QA3]|uniref:ABC transporter ATP-binding protein n=1 Tax=Frankia sp. QA3 TaxID=710111 RepID=UPI000269BC51|nr:ABC transporter ATP-binding protein [Frankia sp. QA3]EIV92204.1 ATPase component of ABC-type sugar transporter [Frankia sp. QA3]
MADIELEHVSKWFADGQVAVDDVNLRVADGELVILVGPSGCGKSTTLNMIAGLEDISDGELRIGGRVVNGLGPADRDIAMVFQSYALYPHMTVRRNIGFPLSLAKVPRARVEEKVLEVARILDLTPLLDRKPGMLSGGQRQRVAMGRAIVRSPAAFLMDEPLSNLDATLRVATRTQVSRLQRRLGTTMVYVTHDQTEAMTLGDRVAVLRAGRVQQVAAPVELYERPVNLFVAGFIGSPAMNVLPATVEGDLLRSPLGEVSLDDRLRRALSAGPPRAAGADGAAGSAARGASLVVGIRPEHFEDAAIVGADRPGGRVRVNAEVVESVGSDKYVYAAVPAGPGRVGDFAGVLGEAGAASVPGAGEQIVARLDAASTVARGARVELWFDPGRLHLFDASSGAALTG